MSDRTALVFTAKSIERILREGGTSSWRLDRNHALKCVFAVCTRNANADWVEGKEAHQSAFLVGRIKDVIPSPDYEGRYLILFSEYAQVDVPNAWKGDRNPFKYSSLAEIGIDPSALNWTAMHTRLEDILTSVPTATNASRVKPLTMAEAKRGLALTFGVSPEAIEITIRG